MTFTLGEKTYTHNLADVNEVGWCLWIQTQETSGSFIFPSGTRHYFNSCGVINEIGIEWIPSEVKDTCNYIIIVIN